MPLVSRTFNQLIDFTRTSSATFVGSNGLIQNTAASRNLLTFTQELVSGASWGDSIGGTGVAPTLTANAAAAPDGTMTADRLQFSLAGGTALADLTRRRQTYTTPATTHTFSIYLRSTDGSSSYNMHIVGPTGATTNIVVDGTWQRFTVTGAGSGAVVAYAVGLRGAQSPANSNTADVLAWGAQLETGSTATDYTRNFGGLFPPRFDYDPVTLAPRGLLIEEQRTNLLLRSEEFDNASWVKGGATATANSTTSPDGTADADALVEDTSTGDHRVFQAYSVTSGIAYVFSVYVKPAGRTLVQLTSNTGASFTATFDISAGTVTNTATGTASISAAGNGWYRLMITATATATTSTNMQIRLVNTGTNTSYTGNGTSGIFLWGAQLEAGAFATSYIPTVASQVTRTADTALIQAPNFAPWYNQSEGTIVAEWALNHANATGRYIVKGSSPTVGAGVGPWVNSNGIDTRAWVGGTSITVGNASLTAPNKVAFGYSPLNNAASLNGASAVANTTATAPADVNLLEIGGSGASQLNGHLRSIRYYPVRLSNAQLQALTA